MKEKISLNDTMTEVLVKMSEGNPGAITVLTQMLLEDHNNFMFILHMDNMNMRGASIWIGYKDHCKEDIKVFIEAVKNRDKDMINTINRELGIEVVKGADFPADSDLPPDLKTLNHI
jgi:hypothetical protein